MVDVYQGQLEFKPTPQGKRLAVRFLTRRGRMSDAQVIPRDHLHPELAAKSLPELDGLKVELELYGNKPRRVRAVGKNWEDTALPGNVQPQPETNAQPTETEEGDFHNPYNFIPTLPRDVNHADLGDREPIGHDCYYDNYWSGKITCTLTTITPLLIPDAAKVEKRENGHKLYPLRCVNGKPYLSPTSIKGMLRNAYEAITNSRFGVFEEHGDRLAYRMSAQNVDVVPARVELINGKLFLRVMQDSNIIGSAAKLPRYPRKVSENASNFPLYYDGTNELPQHGDPVWVRLNAQGQNIIEKSVVTRIRRRIDDRPPGNGTWRKGWVYISGENIKGKKYERIFIESDKKRTIEVTCEIKDLWRRLIKDYQQTHEKDLKKRRESGQSPSDYLGENPGETAWSLHIYQENYEELQDGTFCYIEYDKSSKIKSLLPVILSRKLYEEPPVKLLDSSLLPATSIKELSPADRVFGWVNQQGSGAYKGQLRISGVHYTKCWRGEENDIQEFLPKGLPLQILGQPKRQQARFYIAQDEQGTPLRRGENKEAGYSENQHLRGRKVYPHHRGTGKRGDWNSPMEDRTKRKGFRQEYRRPKLNGEEQRDDQNRSIKAWVNPDVEFQFEVDIVNLSEVELGALLWLLNLPKYQNANNLFHRLGGGKPLGFGSVKIQINETDLRTGQEWQNFYQSLKKEEKPEQTQALNCVVKFKDTVKTAYNKPNFEDVSFVAAFLQSARGFDDNKPIHYPRLQENPDPNGENFEWFTKNESTKGFKLSLPLLVEDQGLPYVPKRPDS